MEFTDSGRGLVGSRFTVHDSGVNELRGLTGRERKKERLSESECPPFSDCARAVCFHAQIAPKRDVSSANPYTQGALILLRAGAACVGAREVGRATAWHTLSLVRVVIICPASTHTALVSSPSLTVVHLSTYIQTYTLSHTPNLKAASSTFRRATTRVTTHKTQVSSGHAHTPISTRTSDRRSHKTL